MLQIKDTIIDYLKNAPLTVQQVLFAEGNFEHPVWRDNSDVFQKAVKQFFQSTEALSQENSLAYVGLHVSLIGKRYSIGFLITNCRILVKYSFSVTGASQTTDSVFFTQKQNTQEVINNAWNIFVTKNDLKQTEEQIKSLQNALNQVVTIVFPELKRQKLIPEEIKKSNFITGRIKELGLQNTLKTYQEKQKIFNEFAKKFKVSTPLFGSVDKSFFGLGSVYGLVLTKEGITSRDLMEQPISVTWGEIKAYPATLGEKKDVFVAGNQSHIVPIHQSEFVPSLVVLINEVATGKVIL